MAEPFFQKSDFARRWSENNEVCFIFVTIMFFSVFILKGFRWKMIQ